MKVSLPCLGFSWYGLKVVDLISLSSSCLGNSSCLSLSGINLTDCGGGSGSLVGLGGLVRVSGLGVLVLH